MTPRPSAADLAESPFQTFLSHIKSQTGDELQQEIKDNKRIDELFDNSRLDDYLPPIRDNSIAVVDNVELTPIKALEAICKNLEQVLDENRELRLRIPELEKVSLQHS